nr:O-antigen ligase family protein [Desulfobacula sp.]
MKSNDNFQFHPLSFLSWISILKETGILGFAFIFASISNKFFDIRDSASVISGKLSTAMLFRGFSIAIAILLIFPYLKVIRLPNKIGLKTIFLYVIFSLLSIFWSYTPIATAGKSIEVLIGMVTILAASSCNNNRKRLMSFFNIAIYLMAVQVLIAFLGWFLGFSKFIEPTFGGLSIITHSRIAAPFLSANSVGYYSALIIIVIINAIPKRVKLSPLILGYLLFFIATLLLSTSRTSIGIVLLGLLSLVYFENKKLFTLLAIPLSIIPIMDFTDLASSIFSFVQGNQAAHITSTLSGRTILWQHALELCKENPFFGSGFGIGSRVLFSLSNLKGFSDTISTAHNGFLEVFMGVGVLGFLPWFIALIYYLSVSLKNYSDRKSNLSILWSIWPVILISSIMSVGIGGASSELFLLFLIVLSYHDIKSSDVQVRIRLSL